MNHIEFLSHLKNVLEPTTYLEIGIASGDTLFSDPLPQHLIGIDPNPRLAEPVLARIREVRSLLLLTATSDDAFEELSRHGIRSGRKVDMAFVDGLHHAEVVLRDIANSARFSRDDALICVHDIFPGTEAEAGREVVPGAWMGDVYKIAPVFWEHLDRFPMILVEDVPPSGMLLLRSNHALYDAIIGEYDNFVRQMEGLRFPETTDEMRRRSFSCNSPEVAEFLAQSRNLALAARTADRAQARLRDVRASEGGPGSSALAPGRKLRLDSIEAIAASRQTLLPAVRYEAPGKCIYATGGSIPGAYGPRTAAIEEVRALRLPPDTRVVVPSPEEFLLVSDDVIAREQVPWYWQELEDLRPIVTRERRSARIDEPCILIARTGIRTWAHWLCELLPKLVCAEALLSSDYKFVLPQEVFDQRGPRSEWTSIRESLAAYGVGAERVIQAEPDTVYTFGQLSYITSVWSDRMIHPAAIELMNTRLPSRDTGGSRSVAFLRTESNKRNVENLDEIVECLSGHGFTMEEPGIIPFESQVGIFSNAREIVSVLGSSLSGLIYASSGIGTVSLAPSGWSDDFFYRLMQVRDIKYADTRGPTVKLDRRFFRDSSFSVDIDELRAGIRAIRS